MWGVAACTTSDEILLPDVTQDDAPVSLMMSVAANKGSSTRMSAANTQNADNFRGIQNLWLVPFYEERKIAVGDTPLQLITNETNGLTISADNGAAKFFFEPDAMRMYVGLASFLVYGRATVASTDPFVNGSLTASYDTGKDFTPANVTFSPDVIPAATTDQTKETWITTYLTNIATAGPDGGTGWLDDAVTAPYFNFFANIYNSVAEPFAGSSTNILKHVNKTYHLVNENLANGALKTAILTAIKDPQYVKFDADLDSITELKGSNYDMTGYPGNLPDGVAGLKWDHSAFVTRHGNNFNSYAYPAELYYYANSRIYTSTQQKEDKYISTTTDPETKPLDTWATFTTREYENKGTDDKGTKVQADTRSIALIEPLQYGVACLEVKIRAKIPAGGEATNAIYAFDDNYGSPSVRLTASSGGTMGTFPLTAILVGGQRIQGFDFTPKYPDETDPGYVAENDPEYIIYDNNLADEHVCLGDFIQGTTDNFSPSLYTLALQTKKANSVKVVLEFENNSGEPFKCLTGTIYPGTKFYLAVSLVNLDVSTDEKDQQVLTKDHKTTLLLTISDLTNAYNALPNLSSDKVRVIETVKAGISDWKPGDSDASGEIHNW